MGGPPHEENGYLRVSDELVYDDGDVAVIAVDVKFPLETYINLQNQTQTYTSLIII